MNITYSPATCFNSFSISANHDIGNHKSVIGEIHKIYFMFYYIAKLCCFACPFLPNLKAKLIATCSTKMLSYEYMKSSCGKKISRLSYIHNWFPAPHYVKCRHCLLSTKAEKLGLLLHYHIKKCCPSCINKISVVRKPKSSYSSNRNSSGDEV